LKFIEYFEINFFGIQILNIQIHFFKMINAK
jgi:hypothetical protein